MIIVYIILGLMALLLFVPLFTKNDYKISRQIMIDQPPNAVYNYLRFFKNHRSFNAWYLKDPNMKEISKGTDGQVGYVLSYEGNKELGSGEQELIGLRSNELVDIELRFLKPFKSTSRTPYHIESNGDNSTNVTLEMQGNMKYPMNLMLLFMDMDKFLGADIQKSLENLKSNLEQQ